MNEPTLNAIIATIDKAGRVVILALLREKLGLKPGTELVLTVEDLSLRLTRNVPAPTIVRVGRRLVVRPTASADRLARVDVAALIEDERDRWPL